MTRYLFDVDGTLTNSRQKIDPKFEEFMIDFCSDKSVAFVTGSEKDKTVEQLGEKLFSLADYSFNCAGNEVWHNGTLVHKNEWYAPNSLMSFFEELLADSKFQRTSNKHSVHVDNRNGMINFSVAGRGCSQEDRQAYVEWDKSVSERMRYRDKIAHKFPELDVMIGGDTGFDIYPAGKGKEQVVDYLKSIENEKTYYFGDQIFPNGNDYKIAKRCDNSYRVKSWTETHEILAFLEESAYC